MMMMMMASMMVEVMGSTMTLKEATELWQDEVSLTLLTLLILLNQITILLLEPTSTQMTSQAASH
jgi:hypothetical protein